MSRYVFEKKMRLFAYMYLFFSSICAFLRAKRATATAEASHKLSWAKCELEIRQSHSNSHNLEYCWLSKNQQSLIFAYPSHSVFTNFEHFLICMYIFFPELSQAGWSWVGIKLAIGIVYLRHIQLCTLGKTMLKRCVG